MIHQHTDQIQHRIEKDLLIISLNNPKSLNALSLEMIKKIRALLNQYKNDPAVRALLFCGNDKAFCAGGDIRGLYYAIEHQTSDYQDFFYQEYLLDYEIYTYPKPTIAFGAGIVMGGGLGLLMACRHKIATTSTLMAMPEISIGLFPDAGASYFLNKIPQAVGLFLGLTGARLTAQDAYYIGLCDVVTQLGIDEVIAAACGDDISNNIAKLHNHAILPADSPLIQNYATISHLMSSDTLMGIHHKLTNHKSANDFMDFALNNYKNGAPISAYLSYTMHHMTKTWSLKDVLAMEFSVALACCQHGEFFEGVRALLIDKDKTPQWRYTLDDINDELMKGYFDKASGFGR